MTDDAKRQDAENVSAALSSIRRGESVVVVDDDSATSQGVLVMAAETAEPDKVAFMVRHTSGVVCVALTGERCDALGLPLMVASDTDYQRTAFTHSVDLRQGTTTGISAGDRTLTIRGLADPTVSWSDFNRPGHVFPLRARDGGVFKRRGRPEAAVDLVRLAGLEPVAALCGLVADDGSMATRGDIEQFATAHEIPIVSISDLVTFRESHDALVVPAGHGRVPTTRGAFHAHAYRSLFAEDEHVAFVTGDVTGSGPVMVSVHVECLLGDIFGSALCACGDRLDQALDRVAEAGAGVVIYLRGEESRGADFDHATPSETDVSMWHRRYSIAAQILGDLGVESVRLLAGDSPPGTAWSAAPTVVEHLS